jgi:hypothetical protein
MRPRGVFGSIVAAAIAATVWPAVSCSLLFDKRGAAEHIQGQLRAMPGVAHTNLTYSAGIATGKNFSLDVTLDESATEQQAVEVARTFVHDRSAEGLGDHDGGITLRYPAAEDTGDAVRDASNATFFFGSKDGLPDPTEQQVADGVGLWARVAHSPVVNFVELFEPNRSGEQDGPNVTVVLRLAANAAAAAELQRDTPGLDAASWEYSVPFGSAVTRRSYASTPIPPSASDMASWTEISSVIGPYYDAKGTTDSNIGARQALTEIDVDIPQSADSTQHIDSVTRGVAALLPRFGHPAALVVRFPDGQLELVVGGCYRHEADHVRPPLELELSKQYEKC